MLPVEQLATAFAALKEFLATVGEGQAALGRTRGRKRRDVARRTFSRLLYTEVLLNLVTLKAGQGTRPPQLLHARRTWDALQHSPAELYGFMDPPTVATIAAAYLHLETVAKVFDQDPVSLVGARIRGLDQQAIEQVAESFRAAERCLRPLAFLQRDTDKLLQELTNAGLFVPPGRQHLLGRVTSALYSLPPWVLYPAIGGAMWRTARSLRYPHGGRAETESPVAGSHCSALRGRRKL